MEKKISPPSPDSLSLCARSLRAYLLPPTAPSRILPRALVLSLRWNLLAVSCCAWTVPLASHGAPPPPPSLFSLQRPASPAHGWSSTLALSSSRARRRSSLDSPLLHLPQPRAARGSSSRPTSPPCPATPRSPSSTFSHLPWRARPLRSPLQASAAKPTSAPRGRAGFAVVCSFPSSATISSSRAT
jgi:hypothetical protein